MHVLLKTSTIGGKEVHRRLWQSMLLKTTIRAVRVLLKVYSHGSRMCIAPLRVSFFLCALVTLLLYFLSIYFSQASANSQSFLRVWQQFD